MKTETKYDLNWTLSHIDKEWVIENPTEVIILLQFMKEELDNRKIYITKLEEKLQKERLENLLLCSELISDINE